MVERPLDPLASGMVRIRFGAGGICGSDMHYYRHARTGDFVVTSPLVLGHEIAGEVVEISGAAPGVKAGDRVALNPSRWCGHCTPCRESRPNLCENIFFMGSASKTPHMQGGFAPIRRHSGAMREDSGPCDVSGGGAGRAARGMPACGRPRRRCHRQARRAVRRRSHRLADHAGGAARRHRGDRPSSISRQRRWHLPPSSAPAMSSISPAARRR